MIAVCEERQENTLAKAAAQPSSLFPKDDLYAAYVWRGFFGHGTGRADSTLSSRLAAARFIPAQVLAHWAVPGHGRLFDEGSQRLKVLKVSPRIVVRRFENESSVREFGMLGEAPQGFTSDMTFANVPMPIDARVVWRA